MADIIQLRRDTAANWVSVNPILANGELGIETDTGQGKVGNGIDGWNSLGYNFVGPQGDKGDKGDTGDTGATGPQGPPGEDGPSDHTLLSNIGTNTHVDLDNHLADATIHFTQASLDAFYLPLTGGTLTGSLRLAAGTEALPSLTWNETNTGFYRGGASVVSFSGAGEQLLQFRQGQTRMHQGTEAVPSYSFLARQSNGMWSPANNTIAWSTNATERMRLADTALTTTVPILAPNGTAALPGVAFDGDPDTGMYRVAADTLGFSAAGTKVLEINSSSVQHFGPAASDGGFYLTHTGGHGFFTHSVNSSWWNIWTWADEVNTRATMYVFSDGSMLWRKGAGGTDGWGVDGGGLLRGTWSDFGAPTLDAQFQKLTQAQYDGITPSSNVIYFIVG